MNIILKALRCPSPSKVSSAQPFSPTPYFPEREDNLNGFLSSFPLAVSRGAIRTLNMFSGAQMVAVIVLKPISYMVTPPKPPKTKSISHFFIYTLGKIFKLKGFMILPACFSMAKSSHPKYSLRHCSLPSHDWTGKLEQWPGHCTKNNNPASLKYRNSVILSTKITAFLWYSE